MKIFVAYGFHDRDAWIRGMVIPIMTALGVEVATGEDVEGQIVSTSVRDRIMESDALIGFLTRRGDPDSQGKYKTHDWVKNELGAAIGAGIDPVLEVRERGLDDEQGGMLEDRQRVWYDESARDQFLVRLVEIISRWTKGMNVTLKVLPPDVASEIGPLLRPGYRCTYVIMEDWRESQPRLAKIFRVPGGLSISARGIPPRALMSVRIEAGGSAWSSPFINVDALDVMFTKEV